MWWESSVKCKSLSVHALLRLTNHYFPSIRNLYYTQRFYVTLSLVQRPIYNINSNVNGLLTIVIDVAEWSDRTELAMVINSIFT